MILTIILIVLGTMTISFFCSLSEAALYSISAGRVETLRRSGTRRGRLLADLRENIEEPISVILILNTIANTVGSTVAGALVKQASGSLALGVFSALFTMAILLFAEVVPKTLGVVHARHLAPLLAPVIVFFIKALWPLVRICEMAARAVKGDKTRPEHSEEDLLSEARLSAENGAILPEEYDWIGNALRLNDVVTRDIMTPRPVVFSLDENLLLSEVKEYVPTWTHSRVPLTRNKNLDETVGVVLRRHVLEEIIKGRLDRKIGELAKPAHFVPESMRGHQLLQEFTRRRQHLFVVVNEYGGTEGIVTLEDVIESLLGREIVDEFDQHPDMRELARIKGEWRKKALKVK